MRATPITMWFSWAWTQTESRATPTSEGLARTSSGMPTAATSTIPLGFQRRPQTIRSIFLSQRWICCPMGHCKSWTARTGAAKICFPSPVSTSQGRKSRKAACPPHWCGILPSILISAVWCCGLTTMPRDGSPQKLSRPCCRGSMRSRWTSSHPHRARITTTACACGWACPSPSVEKGAKNGE